MMYQTKYCLKFWGYLVVQQPWLYALLMLECIHLCLRIDYYEAKCRTPDLSKKLATLFENLIF